MIYCKEFTNVISYVFSSTTLHYIIFNTNLLYNVNYCSDIVSVPVLCHIQRGHKPFQLLHQLNIFIHSWNRVYVKLDSGISSCEEGLITDFWTNILHQCLLVIILYNVNYVKILRFLFYFIYFYSYI